MVIVRTDAFAPEFFSASISTAVKGWTKFPSVMSSLVASVSTVLKATQDAGPFSPSRSRVAKQDEHTELLDSLGRLNDERPVDNLIHESRVLPNELIGQESPVLSKIDVTSFRITRVGIDHTENV